MSAISNYLSALEQDLRHGRTTEHTHRPALKTLLEQVSNDNIHALNEPSRIACGAPDLVALRNDVTVGYVEAKDIGVPLQDAARSEQLQRYRSHLPNLLLTDYLSFIWYVDGEERDRARLATWSGRRLQTRDEAPVRDLLRAYLAQQPPPIVTPEELARRMADLTRMMRDIIVQAIEGGHASHMLQDLRRAVAENLIPELNQVEHAAEFADMYAQTMAYGLFAARANHHGPQPFRRQMAAESIPRTNPFLRDLFSLITGPDLNQEPYAGFVKDLVQLLNQADMHEILRHFGKRTRQEDPIVHFYETFLREYDPRLREQRGVYYTPDPVVSYIVRSVDHILRTRFDLPGGLADEATITYTRHNDRGETVEETAPRVLILDPAAGTGTFLYHVIDHIRARFMNSNNAGMWSGYVRNHLLPRIFGFELLMAPYAVAHLKLGLQLDGQDLDEPLRDTWRYDFSGDERLGVYLTNTLEEAEREVRTLYGPFRAISEEARAAAHIKRDKPIMVVIGNPPYSGHSANQGEWIDGLLKGKLPDGTVVASYYEVDGQPLGERNVKWLQDDYVKFIRWAQWRINETGAGVLAYVSNHSYLDNPTFRGMRWQLLQEFDHIFVLNLHGNSRRKEVSPDGSPDYNVFDIQQGVAITIFVKRTVSNYPATVHYADIWGERKHKYQQLLDNSVEMIQWQEIDPIEPFYFFVPRNTELQEEYAKGVSVTDIFPVHSVGLATARDHFSIHFTRDEIWETVKDFVTLEVEEARETYRLRQDVRDWKVAWAKADVLEGGPAVEKVVPVHYRPFDTRYTYYTGKTRGFICMPRPEVMSHMLEGENLALITSRMTKGETFKHVQATREIVEVICMSSKTSNNGFVFPLYTYTTPKNTAGTLFQTDTVSREPNIKQSFINRLSAKLGLTFRAEAGSEPDSQTFGPHDVYDYIYAVLHAPEYRTRYVEFLETDFPRIPLTSNGVLFRALVSLGRELVSLHLLESPLLDNLITNYPIPGDHEVAPRHPRYFPPGEPEPGTGKPLAQGRVYINRQQYFEGVAPDVWEFQVGGYQVLDKWLKDRKGRRLTYDDIRHYQRVVVALKETMRLMEEIDQAIPGWPLE